LLRESISVIVVSWKLVFTIPFPKNPRSSATTAKAVRVTLGSFRVLAAVGFHFLVQ
jgi:hypothetical protein